MEKLFSETQRFGQFMKISMRGKHSKNKAMSAVGGGGQFSTGCSTTSLKGKEKKNLSALSLSSPTEG